MSNLLIDILDLQGVELPDNWKINGGRASVTRTKKRTMEYYLNSWTYRECCGQSVRECDPCECRDCEDCGKPTQNGYKCEECKEYYEESHVEDYQD